MPFLFFFFDNMFLIYTTVKGLMFHLAKSSIVKRKKKNLSTVIKGFVNKQIIINKGNHVNFIHIW